MPRRFYSFGKECTEVVSEFRGNLDLGRLCVQDRIMSPGYGRMIQVSGLVMLRGVKSCVLINGVSVFILDY